MTFGSPQTIDRIQVEFSTNLAELIAGLHTVNTQLDTTNNAFATSETASQSYAEHMQQAGIAASASAEGFATLAAGMGDLATASVIGSEAASLYAGSMTNTLGAVTTINHQMDLTVDRFNEVNTAATNTATDGTSPFGVLVKNIGGDDTAAPTAQLTQKSPAPFVGIIAGLSAATLFIFEKMGSCSLML